MQDSTRIASLWLIGAGALAFAVWKKFKKSRGLPLPPGPERLPIIGNLLQLPQVQPWEKYREMSKQHGDIMYLEALGQPLVVLGSLSRALDMYEKRAVTYSGRPYLPVLDLIDLNWTFALMQYGPGWRKHRRAFHRFINPNELPKYHSIFNEEVLSFLKKLHATPEDFSSHVRFYFGATIMRVSYGFDDVENNSGLVRHAEIVMKAFSESTIPGRYLVNNFPSLKYVPSWFPGAGWKKECEVAGAASRKTLFDSFESVKENLRKGGRSAYPSMAIDLLDEMPEEDSSERRELESIARNVCATGYIAGSDTTTNSAVGLFFVLAMYPEVQKKAQEEINRVVGRNRLPIMSDRDNLPYLCALIKELGRWYTVVPLGVPHAAAQDGEYDGYFIPKGTIVMANTWAILHDPVLYPDPMAFKPERFLIDGKLDSSVPDPGVIGAFGYGRRACPGRAFSNDTLLLAAACILSVFNVSLPKDPISGEPIPLKFEMLSQVIAPLSPFKCEIKPRSASCAALLQ